MEARKGVSISLPRTQPQCPDFLPQFPPPKGSTFSHQCHKHFNTWPLETFEIQIITLFYLSQCGPYLSINFFKKLKKIL
jgi:hypothetical protein